MVYNRFTHFQQSGGQRLAAQGWVSGQAIYDCHPDASLHYCTIQYPQCPGDRQGLPACRELCEAVVDACSDDYYDFRATSWPANCTGLPSTNCISFDGGNFTFTIYNSFSKPGECYGCFSTLSSINFFLLSFELDVISHLYMHANFWTVFK